MEELHMWELAGAQGLAHILAHCQQDEFHEFVGAM